MIQRLSHATIYVLDQDAAYDFYVNKLGLEVRTDARMENGFRWLTVGPKGQPDLEIALMPTAYPVPTDGPVGELLRAAKRPPDRPARSTDSTAPMSCRSTRYDTIPVRGTSWNGTAWQRERMVGRSACHDGVTRIRTACGGGSSRVFRRAFAAAASMRCAWSTIRIE